MAKIALITGASSGIGEACAHIFAQQGYHLILLGRRENLLEKIAHHLTDKYAIEVKKIQADVRDKENINYVFLIPHISLNFLYLNCILIR